MKPSDFVRLEAAQAEGSNMRGVSFLLVMLCSGAANAEDLIATINKGKTCKLASFDKNQLNCTYVIGDELVIEISGVGERTADLAFPKSNERPGSKYTASVGLADGCIRVKRWAPNDVSVAFISPKDGKAYAAYGPWCSWFAATR